MRGTHGIASHLLQHRRAEVLQPVRQRRAHAGMVLVVARTLNLDVLSVEKEALVSGKGRGAYAKVHILRIHHFPARRDTHLCPVKVWRIRRPERRRR